MRLIGWAYVGCCICCLAVVNDAKSQTTIEAAVRLGSEKANICLNAANAAAAPRYSGDRRAFFMDCIQESINDKKGDVSADMSNAGLLITAYYFGKREWLDKFTAGAGYLSKLDKKLIDGWFNWGLAIVLESGTPFDRFCLATNYVDCSKLPMRDIKE